MAFKHNSIPIKLNQFQLSDIFVVIPSRHLALACLRQLTGMEFLYIHIQIYEYSSGEGDILNSEHRHIGIHWKGLFELRILVPISLLCDLCSKSYRIPRIS